MPSKNRALVYDEMGRERKHTNKTENLREAKHILVACRQFPIDSSSSQKA